MKKIIVLFAFCFVLFAGKAFAATPDPTVPEMVNEQFSARFHQATDVLWAKGVNYFKATFELRGKVVFAWYAGNGDLMGVGTNLSSDKLPEDLKAALQNSYSNFWLTELAHYSTADENGFVATLENADKVVQLKSSGMGKWSVLHVSLKN